MSSKITSKLFFVSPQGNDLNTGTEKEPFSTIEKARDEVRAFKQLNKDINIKVMVREGTYYIANTIVFGPLDSGNPNQTITYCAYPGEKPIISSGKQVFGWKRLSKEGKIWVAQISKNLCKDSKPYTLFEGKKRLSRARSEGFSPINGSDEWSGKNDDWTGSDEDHKTIYFPKNAPLKAWDNLKDVELIIRAKAAWQMNILPVDKVDLINNVVTVSTPALYKIVKTVCVIDNSKTIWIENALEFLDEPGEWVYNSNNRMLYFWPNGDEPGDNIFISSLKEYIKVEGRINYYEDEDEPVTNLIFKGLTFVHGERDTWPNDYRGFELQHSWDLFDRDNAYIRLRGAESCSIIDCHFSYGGGGAIRLDLHSINNVISGNMIENMGGTGILLAGYGPGKKDVNKGNQVVNNYIRNIGELYWHSLGIFVWQSGENRIANNLIHSLPYTGIAVSGRIGFEEGMECYNTIRWHEIPVKPDTYQSKLKYLHSRNNIIENNEIYDAVNTLADGNGIYISGAGTGNIILNNYVHDNISVHFGEGIRCDDDQEGTLIKKNVIHLTGGLGTGIVIKGVNHILNNFITCPAVANKRGMISLELGPVTGSVIQHNILYATQSSHIPYYQNRLYGDGPIPKLRDTNADYNIYYNSSVPDWGDEFLNEERKYGIETHSIGSDPQFLNICGGNFLLAPESPAYKLGIDPIDMSCIGLTKKFDNELEKL